MRIRQGNQCWHLKQGPLVQPPPFEPLKIGFSQGQCAGEPVEGAARPIVFGHIDFHFSHASGKGRQAAQFGTKPEGSKLNDEFNRKAF